MLHTIQQLMDDRIAIIGLATVLALIIIATFAPFIAPYNPAKLDLESRLLPPGREHIMGTDILGRDILSRIIYGTRISLLIATVIVIIELFVGIIIGTVAGYFGGIIDEVLMRLVDILLAFPGLIFALAVIGVLGQSNINLIIALAAMGWTRYARIVRGSILSIKEKGFIESAIAIGCSHTRIATHYILPNILSPVIVLATLNIGNIILSIAGLGFLGLGAQPPTPEWGVMLNEGKSFMETAPHLTIFPGLMIMITVLAFNFLGDGLRDAIDPTVRKNLEI